MCITYGEKHYRVPRESDLKASLMSSDVYVQFRGMGSGRKLVHVTLLENRGGYQKRDTFYFEGVSTENERISGTVLYDATNPIIELKIARTDKRKMRALA